MNLIEQIQGQAKVLVVTGRIDQTSADEFKAALAPWLEGCTAGAAPLVLDFAGVDYISSVGLRVLMLAAKQVKSQQGRIAIAALTPLVAEVFQVSRFNLVFAIHPTVDAAIAALS